MFSLASTICLLQISSWIQTISLIAQTLVCGYVLYKWILKTPNYSQNSNSSNKHKHKRKQKPEEDVKLEVDEKKSKSNGKKGHGIHVHVPEIHLPVPDINIHRNQGRTNYQRLDDDDNSSSGNDAIV